jgi:hypothetical protein
MMTKARRLGLSVGETGVRHRPRLNGASKVSLGDIPRTLAALIPFWWAADRLPLSRRACTELGNKSAVQARRLNEKLNSH